MGRSAKRKKQMAHFMLFTNLNLLLVALLLGCWLLWRLQEHVLWDLKRWLVY